MAMSRKLSNVSDVGRRLKELREQRKLSMREMASAANVAVSLISKIESGKTSPTVATLEKILNAIQVDLYEFFELPRHGRDLSEQIFFPRAEMVVSQDDERKWYYAFPRHPKIKVQMTYEEYRPHTQCIEKELHAGDLAGYVVAGELTIEFPDKRRFTLGAGDAFYIKGNQQHSAYNSGDKMLKLVTAEIR
jgi:transcriptional regulator with XRE-family HTH domain